jgi:hypothetical protein
MCIYIKENQRKEALEFIYNALRKSRKKEKVEVRLKYRGFPTLSWCGVRQSFWIEPHLQSTLAVKILNVSDRLNNPDIDLVSNIV